MKHLWLDLREMVEQMFTAASTRQTKCIMAMGQNLSATLTQLNSKLSTVRCVAYFGASAAKGIGYKPGAVIHHCFWIGVASSNDERCIESWGSSKTILFIPSRSYDSLEIQQWSDEGWVYMNSYQGRSTEHPHTQHQAVPQQRGAGGSHCETGINRIERSNMFWSILVLWFFGWLISPTCCTMVNSVAFSMVDDLHWYGSLLSPQPPESPTTPTISQLWASHISDSAATKTEMITWLMRLGSRSKTSWNRTRRVSTALQLSRLRRFHVAAKANTRYIP